MVFLVAIVDMATDLYLPVLPQMQEYFATTQWLSNLTLGINIAAIGVSGFFYGNLSDAIGRKPVIYFGLILFTISSAACIFSTNIYFFIACRALQGLGGGVAFSVGIAVVRDLFRGGRLAARMQSRMQSIITLSPGIAPIFGGYVAEYYRWQYLFAILTFLSLVLLFLFFFYGRETLRHKPYIFSVTKMISDYRELFKKPGYMIFAIIQVLTLGWFWAELGFLPIYYYVHFNVPISQFGLFILGLVLAYLVGTFINQWALKRYKIYPIMGIGISLIFVSIGLLFIGELFYTLSPMLIILLRVPGNIGCAMVFGNALTLACDHVPHKSGSGAALIGALELILGGVLVTVIATLPAHSLYPFIFTVLAANLMCYVLYKIGYKHRNTVFET